MLTYAIIFVAAIASLNVTATWSRGVSTDSSDKVKNMATMEPCEKAYTEVNENNVAYYASSTPGYNYLVVYTLYNIPVEQAK